MNKTTAQLFKELVDIGSYNALPGGTYMCLILDHDVYRRGVAMSGAERHAAHVEIRKFMEDLAARMKAIVGNDVTRYQDFRVGSLGLGHLLCDLKWHLAGQHVMTDLTVSVPEEVRPVLNEIFGNWERREELATEFLSAQ